MAKGYKFRKSKAQYLDRLTGDRQREFEQFGRPPGGGTVLNFFVTLEDFAGDGPCYAKLVTRTDNTLIEVDQIYSYDDILDGALAGYKCICAQIAGEWVVVFGPCIETCSHAGSITLGTAPSGTEGVAYSHSVSGSGLNASSFAASGLPAGLSMDTSGSITGTPTESGTFYVIVTATAPESGGAGNCTLTQVLPITIEAV